MIYAFGDYELDTGRFELRHRGAAVPLEPQVFEVLGYLLRHRERLVPKDELIEHVRANLARYKTPRQIVVLEEFPRNATGKVLRSTLTPP